MRVNPVVKGRMYKVAGGGPIKGVRFRKDGKVEVLVQDQGKKRNPKKKKPTKRKPNSKKRAIKKRVTKKKANKRNVQKRKAAKKKK